MHVYIMKILCVILPILTSSILINAYDVKVRVLNNATNPEARRRWDAEFGQKYVVDLFQKEIIPFMWKTFNQPDDASRKHLPSNTMDVVVTDLDGVLAEAGGNTISINAKTVVGYPKDSNRTKFYFKSLMYHEGTHIFQWNGEGSCPVGLIEGIAHYVMVKSGFYEKETFTRPGEGSKWDEGYGVTERFLEYCDSLKPGFTPALNNKMRKVFKEDYFKELTGKPLNQLWTEYKNKYGKGSVEP